MASPVYIDLSPELRSQIEDRAHRERSFSLAPQAVASGLPSVLRGLNVQRGKVDRGAALARRPMFATLAESGADAAPKSRGAQLVVYRDGPGDYRAVAIVPWFYRDNTGRKQPCRFAIELKIDRLEEGEEGATAGADLGASVVQSVMRPVLDKVQTVLNHPLAALAASASVLIPGVGPAYLVGYAISQSLVDYAERKTR